jgi:hypothetical protein
MPSRTIITCDCGCKKEIELGEEYVTGAERLLQIKDARGAPFWFLTLDCLKKWTTTYKELAPPNMNKNLADFDDEPEAPPEAMPEFKN